MSKRRPRLQKKRSTKPARAIASPTPRTTRSTASKRPNRSVKGAAPHHFPTALDLPDDVFERALVTGEYKDLIDDYLGPQLAAELRTLARRAQQTHTRAGGGPRVLIVPGIEASKLGRKGKLFGSEFSLFDDVVWADPIDIAAGRLAELSFDHTPHRHQPLGVFLFAYARMKYRLIEDGFDAEYYPYDWRYSVADLGAALFTHIRDTIKGPVHIVAHSMGGLLARAACDLDKSASDDARFIRSVIQVGTPNHGSFLAVHALRAINGLVKAIGKIDLAHSIEELSTRVFNSFPAVYELLPDPNFSGTLDFFDHVSYPPGGPTIRRKLLEGAAATRRKLAPPDARFQLIAGCNHETCVHITRERPDPAKPEELISEYNNEGDGVVPIKLALHDNIASVYYATAEHGSMCNNRQIARAVSDILSTGSTSELPTTPTITRTRALTRRSETELREPEPAPGSRARGADSLPRQPLSSRDALRLLREVASPDSGDALDAISPHAPRTSDPDTADRHDDSSPPSFHGLIVARRAQRRLDIRIAKGSITAARADALVVGTFEGVRPTGSGGPAAAIDKALEGALSEFIDRRMFSSEVGQVCVFPLARRSIRADHALFVGLGPFDRFDNQTQRFAAENVMRVCMRTSVDDFATVLFGAGSGQPLAQSLHNILKGFIDELTRADDRHDFRSITFVEYNDDKFAEMREALYQLARTSLFDPIAVTFNEEVLQPGPEEFVSPTTAARAAAAPGALAQPVYLSVTTRQLKAADATTAAGTLEFRSAALGAQKMSVTVTGTRQLSTTDFNRFKTDALRLAKSRNDAGIRALGVDLVKKILDPQVARMVAAHAGHPIILTLDSDASALPWEAMKLDRAAPADQPDAPFPALDPSAAVTRTLVADNLSVAKYLKERREDHQFTLLLIQNPTRDLAGADDECNAIVTELDGKGARITRVRHAEATRKRLLAEFASGKYDAVHYAGHAFFDAVNVDRGGLICHNNEVLTGPDLASLLSLPALVFLNACESGVVSRSHGQDGSDARRGVCECLLRAGVANVLGTYWPVGDASAAEFARSFYRAVITHKPLGHALTTARIAVAKLAPRKAPSDNVDWSDYMLYGDPGFQLKL